MSYTTGGQTIDKSMNGLISYSTGGGVEIADDSIVADGSITCKNLNAVNASFSTLPTCPIIDSSASDLLLINRACGNLVYPQLSTDNTFSALNTFSTVQASTVIADGSITCNNLFATNETFGNLPLCNIVTSGTNNLLLINRACGNLVYPQLAYDNTFGGGLNTFQTLQANTVIAGSVKCQGAINFDTEGLQGFKTSMNYTGGILRIANNISTGFAPYITFSVLGDAMRIGTDIINVYKNLQIAGATAFQNAIPYCNIVPTLATDLVNKAYVDTQNFLYVLKTSLTTTLLEYAKLASNNIFTGTNTFSGDTTFDTEGTSGSNTSIKYIGGVLRIANNISTGFNPYITFSVLGNAMTIAADNIFVYKNLTLLGANNTIQNITTNGLIITSTVVGPTFSKSMILAAAGTTNTLNFTVNAAVNGYNYLIRTGDSAIFSSPNNTSALTLCTHSGGNTGIRMTGTSVLINDLTLTKPTPQIYTAPLPSFTNCIGETTLITAREKVNTGTAGVAQEVVYNNLPALGLWQIDFQYSVEHTTDNIYTIGIYINGLAVEESRSTHYCPTVSGNVNFALKTSFIYLNTVVNTSCGGYVKTKSVTGVPLTSVFLRVTRIG